MYHIILFYRHLYKYQKITSSVDTAGKCRKQYHSTYSANIFKYILTKIADIFTCNICTVITHIYPKPTVIFKGYTHILRQRWYIYIPQAFYPQIQMVEMTLVINYVTNHNQYNQTYYSYRQVNFSSPCINKNKPKSCHNPTVGDLHKSICVFSRSSFFFGAGSGLYEVRISYGNLKTSDEN